MKKDIYLIENKINGKKYIGQTSKSVKERFQHHCKPSNAYIHKRPLSCAIQKYGKNNFTYRVIESQVENYNEREKYWITYYNSIIPNGYNVMDGGEEPPHLSGSLHPESKLTEEQVESLTNDLKNTDLKLTELAKKYGFSKNTCIVSFNKGLSYVRDIKYPIREENPIGKLTKEDVLDIIQLLKFTYRSFESIGEQYNVEARCISRINRGIFHKQDDEEYPIREGKISKHLPKLTYDEVTEIMELIMDSDLSLRAIGRKYNCTYNDIVNIKNGNIRIYRRRGISYPLRPNN